MKCRLAAAVAAFVLLGASPVGAQQEVARDVYAKVAPSVLLVVAQGPDGKIIAQGSGFIIEGSLVVTNAHVVRGGTPAIATGVARIPCVVTRIDEKNDLAVLRPSAQLDATPLRAANPNTPIGTRVFAIGNPAGLERTITEGIYSGPRQMEGVPLLQISAPISPGSSGGPVVDSSGLVIGIAVGSLEGQNLNFAVPVDTLITLLAQPEMRPSPPPAPVQAPPQSTATGAPQVSPKVAGYLRDFHALLKQRLAIKVTAQTLAEWRLARQREKDTLEEALAVARTDDELLGVYGSALDGMHEEIALRAVRDALLRAPKPLAWHFQGVAYTSLTLAGFEEGPKRDELLRSAKDAIMNGLQLDGGARMWMLAGQIDLAMGQPATAKVAYDMASKVGPSSAERPVLFRGLWQVAMAQNNTSDAAKWFLELVKVAGATDTDHYDNGNFQMKQASWESAAQTFERLASLPSQTTPVDRYKLWYSAAYSRWMLGQHDAAIPHASRTISEGRGKADSARTVAQAHAIISHMLIAKGEYATALEAGRRSNATDPAYFWGYTQVARAANLLAMAGDAEAAAKKAVELSDGSDYDAHFELGMAYFAQKRWGLAQQSFEIVARLDKTNPYAPYNIAQALVNAGNDRDALPWYEEALRRDPKMKERDSILASIARIKGR